MVVGPMSRPKKKLPSILENKPFESPLPAPKPTPTGPKSTPVTPPVVQKRQADAQSFIQAREKALSQGATKQQAVAIAAGQTANQGNQISVEEANKARAALQEIASGVGKVPALTDAERQAQLEGTSLGDILKSAAPDIGLRAGAAGAGAGVAGAIASAPVAAAVGTAAAGAFFISTLSNLKGEAQQNVKIEYDSYRAFKTNIKSIIDGVNKGLIDPINARDMYNNELAKLDRAERRLKALSDKEWLTKGKDELVKIQEFNDVQRPQITALLQQAILAPDPTRTLILEPDQVDNNQQ